MLKNKQRINELKESLTTTMKEHQDALEESFKSSMEGQKSSLESSLNFLNEKIKKLSQEVGTSSRFSKYTVLPPNESSNYLIPTNNPPSTSYFPRYGHTHSVLKEISTLFESELDFYATVVKKLSSYLPQIQQFQVEYKEENLPAPALLDKDFTLLDICLLYSFIASNKPKKFVEIGSGLSTCIVRQAISDHNLTTEIISIDPNLNPKIKDAVNKSIEKPLEQYDLSIFEQLEKNDVVYFNSTHRAFMNSDVTVFMLEVLPHLKPGVLVQMKNIYLPFDYPSDLKDHYWNEQYLVAMHLISGRDKVTPVFPGHYICKLCSKLNKELKYFLLELKDAVKNTALDASPKSNALWFTSK